MARTPMPKPGQILHLTRWQATRQAVALAANMKCECCGVLAFLRGRGAGEADHIIPRRELAQNGGDPFDMENLQWLCQPCHHEWHKTNEPVPLAEVMPTGSLPPVDVLCGGFP